jgi:hypothetical protein
MNGWRRSSRFTTQHPNKPPPGNTSLGPLPPICFICWCPPLPSSQKSLPRLLPLLFRFPTKWLHERSESIAQSSKGARRIRDALPSLLGVYLVCNTLVLQSAPLQRRALDLIPHFITLTGEIIMVHAKQLQARLSDIVAVVRSGLQIIENGEDSGDVCHGFRYSGCLCPLLPNHVVVSADSVLAGRDYVCCLVMLRKVTVHLDLQRVTATD